MKANLPGREPEQLAKWNALHIYETLRKARQGREKFISHHGFCAVFKLSVIIHYHYNEHNQ